MKTIRINIITLKMAAYIYLVIPIIAFYFGWLKFYYALPFSALLIVALFFACKETLCESSKEYLVISISNCIIIVTLMIAWIFMSGIGGFVWQREDWHARNAVLHDLINNKWPVVFEDGGGLVYYVCYFMIPALVGKLFGWGAANGALFLWTFIGIMIVAIMLMNLFKDKENSIPIKKSGILLMFLVLWGGLNVIGQLIIYVKGRGTMSLDSIYGWTAYQYTPNNALLEWVFNQAVPAWIGAVLFLNVRKNSANSISQYGMIIMLLIPFTPYAAIGFLPLLLADIIKNTGKGLLSKINVISTIGILPVFALYYLCNGSLTEEGSLPAVGFFRLRNNSVIYNAVVLIIFLTIEVGIYEVLIWKENKHDYMFVTLAIWLLIIPIIRIGTHDDRMFLMRGSIVPLFILMIYVAKTLISSNFRKRKATYCALIICVIIGFYSGAGDFVLTIKNTLNPEITNVADRVKSMNNDADEEWNEYMNGVSYVVKNADEKFFFDQMAR